MPVAEMHAHASTRMHAHASTRMHAARNGINIGSDLQYEEM